MPNGPPRHGPPASAASYGYEPYPGQGDPYDPYRRMPQPGAAAERYSSGSMPRGPRPQVSLWSENYLSELLLICYVRIFIFHVHCYLGIILL